MTKCQPEVNLAFGKTERGRPSLFVGGYTFIKERDGTAGKIIWRCRMYTNTKIKCPRRCHTLDDKIVLDFKDHNHPSDISLPSSDVEVEPEPASILVTSIKDSSMSSVLLNLKTESSPIPFPTYASPSSGGGGSVGSPGGCGGGASAEAKMFLSHGGRPTKGNGRKRKGVDEYAAENRIDFTSRSIIRDGQLVRILVCRFCCQSIGARSDRIKEHLASKRHQKLKLEAFREAAEAGRDLSQEYSDDSASGLLPEPPITMLKFPGKALAHLLEGEREGRQSSHELTPEPEERRQNMLTPPPLRDFRMNSPPPTTPHPMPGIRGGPAQMSTSRSSPPPPPPRNEAPQQQLLCVRWGNYDSNIVSMFSKLRSAEHFVDVTLWCEGRTIKCHKLVLSACSVYFEQLLVENQSIQSNHPIIFLKDMKFWEIEALVEFMYKGETSIHQDKLQSLLRAAESLQIKGLGSPPPGQGQNPSNDINNNNSSSANEVHTSGLRDSIVRGPSHRPLGLSSSTEDQSDGSMDMTSSGVGSFSFSTPRGNSPNRSITSNPTTHSQIMGMDLSNHSAASNHNLSQSPFLSTTVQGPLSSSIIMNLQHSSAKRRKKETPRRIGVLPRMVHGSGGNHAIQLLPPPYGSSFTQDDGDDDGAGSEDDSNEPKPQNLIAVNGAGGGGSDDESVTGMEPRSLIMVEKAEPLEMEYGEADSDDGEGPPDRRDT